MARMCSMNEKDWAARMDLDCLLEAARIKKDPKRMKAVQKCAKKRKQDLADDIGAVSEVQEKND